MLNAFFVDCLNIYYQWIKWFGRFLVFFPQIEKAFYVDCLSVLEYKLSVSINYMFYVFQQIAPDSDRFENTKEQERQQWLKDLGKYLVGIVHVKGGINLFLRSMINKLSLYYI